MVATAAAPEADVQAEDPRQAVLEEDPEAASAAAPMVDSGVDLEALEASEVDLQEATAVAPMANLAASEDLEMIRYNSEDLEMIQETLAASEANNRKEALEVVPASDPKDAPVVATLVTPTLATVVMPTMLSAVS